MARIVLTTLGSSGDINPYVALALGLRERGHDILFAIEPEFRGAVDAAGFPISPLASHADALTARAGRLFGGSPARSILALVRHYGAVDLPGRVRDLRTACRGADLLVASLIQFAAPIVSWLEDIPWVSVVLSPANIPSSGLPPLPLPAPGPLRRPVTRLQWWAARRIVRRWADTPVNRARAGYGLPPVTDVMFTGNLSERLTAVATSPAIVPPQPDWPPSVRETGFLFWDAPEEWREPPELTAFLDGSRPVVAISSGSMVSRIEGLFAEFFAASFAAARRAGCRALALGASPGALPRPLPDDVLALPYAPFSRVYPRCAAAIHHGGIGTTAQALRAGLPMLVVPWGVDQFFTAGRIATLGAGRSLSRRRYSVDRASRALAALLHEPCYRDAAARLGGRIAAEDGVGTLRDALEGVIRAGAGLG
ncbi:MAG TPA: glycosyltransferase [Thermomicrobiaceae bacterium]|nr:glycosyltransferase [Thermomicrobiaceae bacterium]